MSNKTRKHIWPVSLAMSIAIVGALAAFLVLAAAPGETDAHGGTPHDCSGLNATQQGLHDAFANPGDDLCSDSGTGNGNGGGGMMMPATGDMITSDSKTASGSPELKLTIASLGMDLAVGSSIVVYLEDDFAEPDSIPMSSVYLVAENPDDLTGEAAEKQADKTGNGSRVYVTSPVKIKTGAYFDEDKKDIAIRVLVPDMCTTDTTDCQTSDGPKMGQKMTLVIESDSGIKNPSEAGTHSVFFDLVGSADPYPSASNVRGRNDAMRAADPSTERTVNTVAKITLSDVDNKRGYEMTVTGSGFNDGTTADVHVLANARFAVAKWWNSLDCAKMKMYMGSDSNRFCFNYTLDESAMSYTVGSDDDHADFDALSADDMKKYSDMVYSSHLCRIIVEDGTKAGGALVGSDDKVAVTFEVTAPTFRPGNVNYICMVDGEGRMSNTDVEDFNLEPSIKVVPSSVNSGDTVNVFAQDYPMSAGSFALLKLAGEDITGTVKSSRPIGNDGSGEATFDVPGGFEGVLRIDAQWGTGDNKVSKNSKITIAGGELDASKTDALPNETITITGNGFATGQGTCIPVANITLDSVPVMVDPESISTSGGCKDSSGVEVSNSGQFVATIVLWPDDEDDSNPTLIPGTHELSVEDNKGFGAGVSITIPEPTIKVTPDVAGPRDYVTITGENWPVDNPDGASTDGIKVDVDDGRSRPYTLFADAVGRVSQEHRVYRNVAIPSTVQVKMTYGDVAKIGSFAVPASTIEVAPGEGQPGDMISLTSGNMPVYSEVDYVEIGGTRSNDPGVNTDRDGNVTVEDVLIPGLDPGVYSVVINVGGTIAIGEINVLAESSAAGAPAELPGAVESLGDNLVAIFHFDDVGKEWSFYDPRPEFADLNTLTEMVNGEAYWILVSETVDDVVLNNKVRSLTCRGSDCWNLEVW